MPSRIRMLFAIFDVDFDRDINLSRCLEVVRSLHMSDSMRVIKTWANGWTASSRLHETQKFPCLFGCLGQKDDFRHYVHCPILRAMCCFLKREIPPDPLIHFGIRSPSKERQLHVCSLFSGYHALFKHAEIHLPNTSDRALDNLHRRMFWSVFANAYAAEARELSVSFRQFSLSNFVVFLIDFED